MFNLLISYNSDLWADRTFVLERGRVAVEYTADEISERYKSLDQRAIDELTSFPSLFAIERDEEESRIGYISTIRARQGEVVISFEYDEIFPPLPAGTVQAIGPEIGLGRLELSRTHWAVKDDPLFEILVRRGLVTQEQVERSYRARRPPIAPTPQSANQTPEALQVFVVHGHDEIAKFDVADFIKSLGLEPIILHQQASHGMTIIEKIERYTNVGFGVVLYTTCDVGNKNGELVSRYRARQNVVFEHGYLMAKLGRPRVTALVKGEVEVPNDISGVLYVPMDDVGAWQEALRNELRAAGYQV